MNQTFKSWPAPAALQQMKSRKKRHTARGATATVGPTDRDGQWAAHSSICPPISSPKTTAAAAITGHCTTNFPCPWQLQGAGAKGQGLNKGKPALCLLPWPGTAQCTGPFCGKQKAGSLGARRELGGGDRWPCEHWHFPVV